MATNSTADERHQNSEMYDTGMGIFFVLFFFLISGANCLPLLAVLRFERMKTKVNFFVINLSAAGFLVGIVALLEGLRHLERGYFETKFLCLLGYCLLISLSIASLMMVFGITVDRFIAITRALRYHSLVTRRRLTAFSAFTWVSSFAIGTAPMGWNNWSQDVTCRFSGVISGVYFLVFNLLPFIVIASVTVRLYWAILKIARRQVSMLNAASPRLKGSVRTKRICEEKAAKMFAFVVVGFLGCWFPLIASCSIHFLYSHKDILIFRHFATFLFLLYFFVNPFFYWWRDNRFRKAYKELWLLKSCLKRKGRPITKNGRAGAEGKV